MNWEYELFIMKFTVWDVVFLLMLIAVSSIGIIMSYKKYRLRKREKLKEEVKGVLEEEIESALRGNGHDAPYDDTDETWNQSV